MNDSYFNRCFLKDGAGKNLPTMLIGNKSDMRETSAKYGKKCVSTEQGKKLAAVSVLRCYIGPIFQMSIYAVAELLECAQEAKCCFSETSAKLGTNINESILDLAKMLLKAEDDEKKQVKKVDFSYLLLFTCTFYCMMRFYKESTGNPAKRFSVSERL